MRSAVHDASLAGSGAPEAPRAAHGRRDLPAHRHRRFHDRCGNARRRRCQWRSQSSRRADRTCGDALQAVSCSRRGEKATARSRVFTKTSSAVSAALAAREALEAHRWPDGLSLQVRMAVHTGEAHERDGDYLGPTVNRAARLRGLANGGQILLSEPVAALVRDDLPEGWDLVELGEQALRDSHDRNGCSRWSGPGPSSAVARRSSPAAARTWGCCRSRPRTIGCSSVGRRSSAPSCTG